MTINFNDSVDEDCGSLDLIQNHLLKQAAEQPSRENYVSTGNPVIVKPAAAKSMHSKSVACLDVKQDKVAEIVVVLDQKDLNRSKQSKRMITLASPIRKAAKQIRNLDKGKYLSPAKKTSVSKPSIEPQ